MTVRHGLTLILLVLSPLAAKEHNPITLQLDAKEKQLEELYADYWRAEYQIALGDEHLSSRPVQERIREVITDEKFLADLKSTRFNRPMLTRRRDLFVEEAAYTKISNDPTLTALVENITRAENSFRYKVGDRRLTRAELTDIVAHSPDSRLRQQAWEARAQITAINGERIREAMRRRNELALQYADELFSVFMSRRKGFDTQALFEWFDQIRTQTEPAYQALLKRMRQELRVDTMEPWDLESYFSVLTNDFERQKFVPEQGWTITKKLADNLGYDLERLPVQMQVADLSFAGAAYPILYGKEVKILANRYSGIFFFDRLLHATGHALHYSMMNEPSFLLRNNYAEPFDEGLAQVMALRLYRPEVETELFGLTREQAQVVAETSRWKTLFELRRTMADSLFEFEAYAEPDQDLAALYNRIHAKYLGVDMHAAALWAYNPMYGSDPIYLQSYVVGDMIAHQISHTIDRKFGAQWDKKAGAYLEKHFYSRGADHTMGEMMQSGTGEPLTVRYLINYLRAYEPTQNNPPKIRAKRMPRQSLASRETYSVPIS
jgi:Zn-dependent M32 family carboxypeptidase